MKYIFNTYNYLKNLVPHFLQFSGDINYWTNGGGLMWITSTGASWGNGSENRHLDWLKCLIAPMIESYNDFLGLTDRVLYDISHNGQVIYLEHFLNDLFDLTQRRIVIKDGTLGFPPYIYNKAENETISYIFNKSENEEPYYIYNRIDYNSDHEFVVCVPSEIVLTESLTNQIKAAVNRYKIAGVRYVIESM